MGTARTQGTHGVGRQRPRPFGSGQAPPRADHRPPRRLRWPISPTGFLAPTFALGRRLCFPAMVSPTHKAQLRLAAKRSLRPKANVGARNPVGEIGHLRRLGGRWSALGGAWPDPKGPGRCLPTPWVPWVRAVPIGPLRWPGGRSRGPESAVLPSGAMAGTQPVRPCTRTMRPALVPELPVAGPHAPRGPTRSLGWAGGGCFGLQDAPWA